MLDVGSDRNLANEPELEVCSADDAESTKPTTKSLQRSQSNIEIQWYLKHSPTNMANVDEPIAFMETNNERNENWSECMRRFYEYTRAKLEKEAGPKNITIALIDDGVDYDDETVGGMVFDGRSYYQRQEQLHVEPYWMSTGGHGTNMAGMIQQLCPMAKLFVVRLNEYNSPNGLRQIHASSAAMVSQLF